MLQLIKHKVIQKIITAIKNDEINEIKKKLNLSDNVTIEYPFEIRNPQNIYIGHSSKLGHNLILRPRRNKIIIGKECGINPYVSIFGKVKIGDFAMIAPFVMIAGGNHSISDKSIPMIKSGKGSNQGIVIEDDVWIGANSTILDGVRIGKGAVVGAGSVVKDNVDSYGIYAGNPAKKIGLR